MLFAASLLLSTAHLSPIAPFVPAILIASAPLVCVPCLRRRCRRPRRALAALDTAREVDGALSGAFDGVENVIDEPQIEMSELDLEPEGGREKF